ncbi:hypothetical protein DEM26_18100 [Thioclava sp. NG1]|uniref:hypothetical protein n=1 Tax=Thioclava sp. NG1 TaxID=2182426 RepID=UPI000D615E64|nr:hypothetical protein [Thioclava sp. NG1]PWE48461.1 hypothetical protein DEM26_18100 [Thioclava sp. NG1]
MSGASANRGITVSEAEFRRLWADRSLTRDQIGQRLGGISGEAVRNRAMARGLPFRGKCKRHIAAVQDEAEFERMWLANVSSSVLAEHYRCSRAAIRKTAKRLGLPSRKSWPRQISMAKFREIDAVRAMHEIAAKNRAEWEAKHREAAE